MSNRFYSILVNSGNFAIELFARPGLSANYSLGLPNTAPTNGQYLKWDSASGSFVWDTPSVGGGGSVSSVGLSLPNIFNVSGSPVTGSGTLTGDFVSQTANTVFAAPVGANGTPVFRALANADLPSGIDASKISGTLGKSNIPNGTNATTFQLNGSSGVTLGTDAGGNLYIYGADGSTITDLFVRNLNVSGDIDSVSSTNTNIGDSQLTMLSDYTGSTPSTDVNFTVKRGTLTNASLRWNESTDRWQGGLDDNLLDLSRTASVDITNADISGGNYVFTHNLKASTKDPTVTVKRSDNREIKLGVTFTSADSVTIDFSRVGTLTGTWKITATV
jgi:hypothetical protein